MGRSRYRILKPDAPRFLTCTAVNWTPLLIRPDSVQILPDAFDDLQLIEHPEVLRQTMDYTHHNPLKCG